MNDHDQQVCTGLMSGGAIAQNRFDRRQHEDPTQTCISSSLASFSSSSQLFLIFKLIKSPIPNCEILQSQLSNLRLTRTDLQHFFRRQHKDPQTCISSSLALISFWYYTRLLLPVILFKFEFPQLSDPIAQLKYFHKTSSLC